MFCESCACGAAGPSSQMTSSMAYRFSPQILQCYSLSRICVSHSCIILLLPSYNGNLLSPQVPCVLDSTGHALSTRMLPENYAYAFDHLVQYVQHGRQHGRQSSAATYICTNWFHCSLPYQTQMHVVLQLMHKYHMNLPLLSVAHTCIHMYVYL